MNSNPLEDFEKAMMFLHIQSGAINGADAQLSALAVLCFDGDKQRAANAFLLAAAKGFIGQSGKESQ